MGLRHITDPAVFRAAAGHPRLIDEQRDFFSYRIGALGLRLQPSDDDALGCPSSTAPPGAVSRAVSTLMQDRSTGLVCFDYTTRPPTFMGFSKACAQLVSTLARRSPILPAPARAELLRRVPALRRLLPIELHPTLAGTARSADLRPVLRLAPLAAGPIEVQAHPTATRGPLVAPGEGPDELESVVDEARVFTTRDLTAEREAVQDALGEDADRLGARRPPAARRPHPRPTPPPAGPRRSRRAAASGPETACRSPAVHRPDLQLSVGSGTDWLGLASFGSMDSASTCSE